jgi:hypothetical protein
VPGPDQGEVVDPGDRCRGLLGGLGGGVHVPTDDVGDRGAEVASGVAHADVGEVERVEDELDASPDQGGVDLVGVAVQGHRRGLGDRPVLGPPERLAQDGRGRDLGWAGGQEPGQGCLPGFGVDPLVVHRFDPGGERLVELREVADLRDYGSVSRTHQGNLSGDHLLLDGVSTAA